MDVRGTEQNAGQTCSGLGERGIRSKETGDLDRMRGYVVSTPRCRLSGDETRRVCTVLAGELGDEALRTCGAGESGEIKMQRRVENCQFSVQVVCRRRARDRRATGPGVSPSYCRGPAHPFPFSGKLCCLRMPGSLRRISRYGSKLPTNTIRNSRRHEQVSRAADTGTYRPHVSSCRFQTYANVSGRLALWPRQLGLPY